jgi:hypothetical protein
MLRCGQSVYEGYSFGIKNRFCETHSRLVSEIKFVSGKTKVILLYKAEGKRLRKKLELLPVRSRLLF